MISQLSDVADAAVVDEVASTCNPLAPPHEAVALAATPPGVATNAAPSVAPTTRLADVSATGVRDLVKVFKLLSDETRLRILLYLTQRPELHVRALCDKLRQSQPAVSHHLALLRVAGLIECRREGKHNFYHLLPQRFEQLLDTVFEAVPSNERQIRFEDYVLKHAPRIAGD